LFSPRGPPVASPGGTIRGRRGAAMADVVESTEIPGVWLIRPEVHADERGRVLETYRTSWLPFAAAVLQTEAHAPPPREGGGAEVAIYIPEGVGHGFYAHDDVVMTYLVTGEYDGTDEL